MRTLFAIAPLLFLACAAPGAARTRASAQGPASDPALARFSPELRQAILARRALRGMDAEALTLAWGKPTAVERRPSAAAAGLIYERWRWSAGGGAPEREAVLVDGRVIDAWSAVEKP